MWLILLWQVQLKKSFKNNMGKKNKQGNDASYNGQKR